MSIQPPSYIQLKTRGHKGTLINNEGYSNNDIVFGDVIGRTLTGTRFSGRRCSVPYLPPLKDLPHKAHAQRDVTTSVLTVIRSGETNAFSKSCKCQAHLINDTHSTSVKSRRSNSAPSLRSKDNNSEKRLSFREEIDRYTRHERRLSDTFTMGLATFRKHRQIRAAAGRRLSEIYYPSKARRFSQLLSATVGGIALGGAVSKWISKAKKSRITPLQRFKNYGKLALICVRLCKYSHQNVESAKDEYLSIIQVTEDFTTKLEDQDGIYFDPAIYRANKEERLPTDARKILQKDQKYRSFKEISYLHIVLRSIKAFAEYPTKMQEQICKVAWYECYESKRAIVRQGQPPLAFYFILSGSVVVTSHDRMSGGTTFLVALHRGMSFGELAVINKSRRQATVSTGTTTELLCISASDFVEIFMAGGIKSITDPETNPFIKSIPFLKRWPIECLAENPQACMFHFFGRGQVLVRDSNHSDWIYVVKSGSLSVLKKLVEVKPRAQRRNGEDIESEDGHPSSKSKSTFGTWDFRIKRNKYSRDGSVEKEVFKNNIEADKRLEQTLPGYYNNRDRLGVIDYDHIIHDHKARVLATNKKMSISTDQTALPKLNMPVPDQESIPEVSDSIKDGDISETEDEKILQLPKIRRTSKHVEWGQPQIMRYERNTLQVPKYCPKGAYLATKNPTRRKKVSRKEAIQEEIYQKQLEYDKKLSEQHPTGRKTIVNELDNKPIKDLTLTEKDIRPMFVQVQVLERGQHFGLTKTVFPEQAESFSVVSNGAECIMISKKFFMEKATEATMHHLRQVETLLPPEDELQNNLQDYVDWKAHRARVYKRLVQDKVGRTVRHNQYPPSYGGQYSFRTGPIVRN